MGRIDDWFDVGWDAFNDMEAQRAWLGGFGAAWAEASEEDASIDEALVRALDGRAELLRQLRSHREGWGNRTVQ